MAHKGHRTFRALSIELQFRVDPCRRSNDPSRNESGPTSSSLWRLTKNKSIGAIIAREQFPVPTTVCSRFVAQQVSACPLESTVKGNQRTSGSLMDASFRCESILDCDARWLLSSRNVANTRSAFSVKPALLSHGAILSKVLASSGKR